MGKILGAKIGGATDTLANSKAHFWERGIGLWLTSLPQCIMFLLYTQLACMWL